MNLIYLLAVLQVQEGRHAGDVVLRGNVLTLININFEKDNISVLLGHGLVTIVDENMLKPVVYLWLYLNLGSNHLAGATPCGVEVDNNQLATSLGELGSEITLKID